MKLLLIYSTLFLVYMTPVRSQDGNSIQQYLKMLGLDDLFANATTPNEIKNALKKVDLKELVKNPVLQGMIGNTGVDPRLFDVFAESINMKFIVDAVDVNGIFNTMSKDNSSDIFDVILHYTDVSKIFDGIDISNILKNKILLETIQNKTSLDMSLLKALVNNIDTPKLLAVGGNWKNIIYDMKNASDRSVPLTNAFLMSLLQNIDFKQTLEAINIQNLLQNPHVISFITNRTALDKEMIEMIKTFLSAVDVGNLLKNVDLPNLVKTIQSRNVLDIYNVLIKNIKGADLLKDINTSKIKEMLTNLDLKTFVKNSMIQNLIKQSNIDPKLIDVFVNNMNMKTMVDAINFQKIMTTLAKGNVSDITKVVLDNINLSQYLSSINTSNILKDKIVLTSIQRLTSLDMNLLNTLANNIDAPKLLDSVKWKNIITGLMTKNTDNSTTTPSFLQLLLKNINTKDVLESIDLKTLSRTSYIVNFIKNNTMLNPQMIQTILSMIDVGDLLQHIDLSKLIENIQNGNYSSIYKLLINNIKPLDIFDSLNFNNMFQMFSPMLLSGTNISSNCIQAFQMMMKNDSQLSVLKLLDAWGKPPAGLAQGNMQWYGAYEQCKSYNNAKYCLAGMKMKKSPLITPFSYENPHKMLILDAWGKPPAGLAQGNMQWYGAYEQCKSYNNAKYCLAGMKMKKSPLGGSYATCIPKVCSYEDNLKIVSTLFKPAAAFITISRHSAGVRCEEPIKYRTGFIITLLLCAIILTLCLLGTIIDLFSIGQTKKTYMVNGDTKNLPTEIGLTKLEENQQINPAFECDEVNTRRGSNDYILTQENEDVKGDKTTTSNFLIKFFLCFSLLRNNKAIMSTTVPKGAITSINGIRTISMLWVILGHLYFFAAYVSPPANIMSMFTVLQRYSFQAIANAYVSVDTFFLLSGLLVSYLALKRMDKNEGKLNIPMFYLHRFIRLTPPYMFAILFWNNVFPMLINGPRSSSWKQPAFQKPCNQFWWTNMLYINNLYPHEMDKECLGWSWYLANDMQFYIASPIFLYLFYYLERKYDSTKYRYIGALIVSLVGCVLCVIVNLCLFGINDYESINTAAFLPGNPRAINASEAVDVTYIKPWSRIAPYIVGLFLGYLLSRKIEITSRFKKSISFVGWLAAFVLAYSVVYGPYSVFKEGGHFFTKAETVTYGSFHRLSFGIAVAWVIYACHTKVGGLVNDFLSWRVFIPLSRLTFGVYLLHPLVLLHFYFTFENALHYQDDLWAYFFIANTFLSYVCSYVMAICVEYPILNLEKMVFKSK